MVRWYHAIFSAYGFWLPNDPRGSWSDFVHAYELFRFGGAATTVTGKRSYAHDPHDVERRREAKTLLKYPPVRFDARRRAAIGRGIARVCDESGLVVHACAVGFDHVHIVTTRHPTKTIEAVVAHLKSFATKQFNAEGIHPLARFATAQRPAPTPWGVDGQSVFLNDEEQLRRAIAYVARHPVKEGLAPQDWSFLKAPRFF